MCQSCGKKTRKHKYCSVECASSAVRPKPHINASLSKAIVFEVQPNGPKLDAEIDPLCGDVIDLLISVTEQNPEYLRKDYSPWILWLLRHFKAFEMDRRDVHAKVADLPIRDLGFALPRWIMHFFSQSENPLMPTFALATAEYIDRHCFGYTNYSTNRPEWMIKRLLNEDARGLPRREEFYFLNDRSFKKNFTERMGEIVLKIKAPTGCYLEGEPHFSLLGERARLTDFVFITKRCYLSSNFYDYYSHFEIHEPKKPEFDLFEGLRLPGLAISGKPESPGEYPCFKSEVPLHWVYGIVKGSLESDPEALPHWDSI